MTKLLKKSDNFEELDQERKEMVEAGYATYIHQTATYSNGSDFYLCYPHYELRMRMEDGWDGK